MEDINIWLEPSASWLDRWDVTCSGAPFELFPMPTISLLRPGEPFPTDRLAKARDAIADLLPVKFAVREVQKVYSAAYLGTVLAMILSGDSDKLRGALGTFGPNTQFYRDGTYTPHMILCGSAISSRPARAFIGSLQTYTHMAEIEFDTVVYGDNLNRDLLYEKNVETFRDVLSGG